MELYADRGFVTINGIEVGDMETASFSRNQNLTRVETMTRNRRTAGFRKGNLAVNGSLQLAIKKLQAQVDLAIIDESTEVNAVFEVGGDRYTVKGLAETDMAVSTSVGTATKTSNWEAIDIVNENGTSVNASLSLG